MAVSEELDSIDRAIIGLLIENARRSASEIAALVNLTPSPVTRRIERLERLGVITGYTALVDHTRLGAGLEAFAELRFAGNTKVEDITRAAADLPEVIEVLTVAGDPDALVRFRATDVHHLAQVIDRIRRDGNVIGTKTLMILGSWRRAQRDRPDSPR